MPGAWTPRHSIVPASQIGRLRNYLYVPQAAADIDCDSAVIAAIVPMTIKLRKRFSTEMPPIKRSDAAPRIRCAGVIGLDEVVSRRAISAARRQGAGEWLFRQVHNLACQP
jgi:hypothetical protein